MTSLPNPFFNSALDLAESAAGLRLSDPAVPAAALISPGDAPASLPSGEIEPSVTLAFTPGESISRDTEQVIEYFLDHAQRRCMDKISPPAAKQPRDIDSIGLRAVSRALDPYLHPRDLDEDPLPLSFRKPRPEFLRTLFSLGGIR